MHIHFRLLFVQAVVSDVYWVHAVYNNLLIKGIALLTIGYTNFSHVTIVFIAKYLFTGSVKILNKIVFKIAIKFISMRNPEISYCLYSDKFT